MNNVNYQTLTPDISVGLGCSIRPCSWCLSSLRGYLQPTHFQFLHSFIQLSVLWNSFKHVFTRKLHRHFMQYVTTYVDIWSAVLVLNEESEFCSPDGTGTMFQRDQTTFLLPSCLSVAKTKIFVPIKVIPTANHINMLLSQIVLSDNSVQRKTTQLHKFEWYIFVADPNTKNSSARSIEKEQTRLYRTTISRVVSKTRSNLNM